MVDVHCLVPDASTFFFYHHLRVKLNLLEQCLFFAWELICAAFLNNAVSVFPKSYICIQLFVQMVIEPSVIQKLILRRDRPCGGPQFVFRGMAELLGFSYGNQGQKALALKSNQICTPN